MREAFTLFDSDGDGRIPPTDLGILMSSLGGNPTQAQLKSIIASEGLAAPFDFPRFLDLLACHLKAEPFDRQLRDTFNVLDKKQTGKVAVANLRHVLTSIGEKLEAALHGSNQCSKLASLMADLRSFQGMRASSHLHPILTSPSTASMHPGCAVMAEARQASTQADKVGRIPRRSRSSPSSNPWTVLWLYDAV